MEQISFNDIFDIKENEYFTQANYFFKVKTVETKENNGSIEIRIVSVNIKTNEEVGFLFIENETFFNPKIYKPSLEQINNFKETLNEKVYILKYKDSDIACGDTEYTIYVSKDRKTVEKDAKQLNDKFKKNNNCINFSCDTVELKEGSSISCIKEFKRYYRLDY